MERRGRRLGMWLCLVAALGVGATATGCGDKASDDDASAEKEKRSKKAADDEDDDDEDDAPKKKKKKSKKGDDGDAKSAEAEKPADTKPAATAEVAPSVTGNAPTPVPVTNPSLQTYPDLPNPIADNCQTPWVIAGNAPNSVGSDYAWTWTRQAMLANQQFKVVPGKPSAPGEVSFDVHGSTERFNGVWVLVARCVDGGTCNKLGAMIKGSVPGAPVQVGCGTTLPMDLSSFAFPKPVLRELGNPQNSLPQDTDTIGQCARLHACTVAMDPPNKAGKEQLGLECQKAPSKFKRECAKRYPCVEVMSCMGN